MEGLCRQVVAPAADRQRVAVVPFADRTGEPGGDLRVEMMAELLRADLSESRALRNTVVAGRGHNLNRHENPNPIRARIFG